MMLGRQGIEIKSAEQIQAMRQAGLVVARTLQALVEQVRPGMRTADLDAIAHQMIRDQGATPSFLGYHGFPAVICTSVNEEVVHGIPGDRVLHDGDLLSIDCGAIVAGWHGDAAVTVALGAVSEADRRLSEVTEAAMWAGLAQARAGRRLSDISHAVESSVLASGEFGIVQEYTGHGIGTAMHMAPAIPNHGAPGRGPTLKVGMALAIEPMVTLGGPVVQVLSDGWTVVTSDDSRSAHWEHTVAITPEGPWVLTALEDVRL